MANRIDIDPRLILPWTTGTQYRIAVTQNLVTEVGNNRTPSPAITNSKTFTTPTERPKVVSVSPVIGSTTVTSTATLTYNRVLYPNTGTNFYLYRETTGTSDLLVATIPSTSTRITKVGRNVSISFRDLLVPDFRHYLTADQGVYEDLFNFQSDAITTSTVFNYVPGPGADILTVTPAFGQTNQFVNNVNITYNKNISRINTGNYYLNYESSGTVRSFAVSSSSIVVNTTGSAVQISFADSILPEGEYYITNDRGIFTDQHNFPYPEIYDASEIKWLNTSISNMNTVRYRGEVPYAVFTTTNPRVLDIDLNTATQYTFTLEAPIGEFSSALGGTDAGSYWTFTGTKTQINNLIESIVFTTNTQENPPSTYTYSLSKNGVTLVNKTRDLLGIVLLLGAPGPTGKALPRLDLGVTGTNSIDENITLTANISTSTTLGGVIVFKQNNVEIATVPLSTSGFATTVTTFSSTGSRFISASWPETTISGSRYEALDSADKFITIDTRSNLPGELQLSAVNLPTRRLPVGPPVDLLAQLSQSPAGTSSVSFVEVTPQSTTTSFTSATSLTITASGERYVELNNVSTIKVGDWLNISGTMTGVGTISSNYQVSSVSGLRINFNNRSEDDNLYYWYDPLKEAITPGITVTFNPIVYQGTFTKPGFNRLTANTLSTVTVVGNSSTFRTSFSSTGTKYIVADWSGVSTVPKLFPKSSELITFQITERADYNGSLLLNLNTSTVGQFESARYNIQLSTPEPTTGTVQLTLISTLGTGTYSTVTNTSSIVSAATTTSTSFISTASAVFGITLPAIPATTLVSSTSSSVTTATTTRQFFNSTGLVDEQRVTTATTRIVISTQTNYSNIITEQSSNHPGIANPTIAINIQTGFSGVIPSGASIGAPYIIGQQAYVNYYTPNTTFAQTVGHIFYIRQSLGSNIFFRVENESWFIRNTNDGRGTSYSTNITRAKTNRLIPGTLTPDGTTTTLPAGTYPVFTGQMVAQSISTGTVRTVTTTSNIRTKTDGVAFVEQYNFTAPFVNGTATVITSPGVFNTTATVLGSNKLKATWAGQTFVANTFYPYYGIESTTSTQFVTPVVLQLAGVTTVSENYQNTFTVSLNTTSAVSGTISLFEKSTKLATVQNNNNSATITLEPGNLNIGLNYLTGIWDQTAPASISNTLTVECIVYDEPNIELSGLASSYIFYNNNNTTNTDSLSISVTAGGLNQNGNNVPIHPTGIVSLVDSTLGVISTATLTSSTNFRSTANLNWVPAVVGQTLGNRNLSIQYQGDYWFASSAKSSQVNLVKRPSPNIQSTATGMFSAGPFVFQAGSIVKFQTVKPNGFTFANPLEIYKTIGNAAPSLIGSSSFTGNTATFSISTLTEGLYKLNSVYPEDQFALSTSSNSVDISIFRKEFRFYYPTVEDLGSSLRIRWFFTPGENVPFPTGNLIFTVGGAAPRAPIDISTTNNASSSTSSIVVFTDRSLLAVGQSVKLDEVEGYTITSVATQNVNPNIQNNNLLSVGITPSYNARVFRPQIFSGPGGETGVLDFNQYQVAFVVSKSSVNILFPNAINISVSYSGDNVWLPINESELRYF